MSLRASFFRVKILFIKSVIFSFAIFLLGSANASFAMPLPAAVVFKLEAAPFDPNTFVLNWTIKPGYFLYQKKIDILPHGPQLGQIGPLRLPPSENRKDKMGQVYPIYRHHLALPVAFMATHSGEMLLEAHYQGCSDEGYCYPPEKKIIKLTFDEHRALVAAQIEAPEKETGSPHIDKTAGGKTLDDILSNSHWLLILLTFWGLGLLLAFTPCILPMVPVLSGLIVGHGPNLTLRKAFFLSLAYVLSMSFTYALVGFGVAIAGKNLQMIMQSGWAIGLLSSLFFLLALSMFGLFEFRLPQTLQMRLANFSRAHAKGHYLGSALMGTLSILILSPCVTPPLIAVLSFIAQSGQLFLGTMALFFMGLGMGTPLILVGISAGRWLPKAGAWMNGVKAFFGVMMLAMALYLLARLLPGVIIMFLWSLLFIGSGIFMGAFESATSHFKKITKLFAIVLVTYGILILVGASLGHQSPWFPLAQGLHEDNLAPISITKTRSEVQNAIQKAYGTPVILDFYADWCTSCKTIEATTLKAPNLQAQLKKVVWVRVDLTHQSKETEALMREYAVIAPPTFLYIDAHGKLLRQRLIGDISVQQLQAFIENRSQDAFVFGRLRSD